MQRSLSAGRYRRMAARTMPVVQKVVADRQLRQDLRDAIHSGKRVSEQVQGESIGAKATFLMADEDVADEIDRLMDSIDDAARRVQLAAARERRRWGRVALVAGVVVPGAVYVGMRKDVRDKVVSLAKRKRPEGQMEQAEPLEEVPDFTIAA